MYVVISHDPSIIQPRHAAYGPFETYETADSLRRKLLAQGVEIWHTQRPNVTVVPLESVR